MADVPPILDYRAEPPSDRILFEHGEGIRICVPPQRFGMAAYAGVIIFTPVVAFIGVAFLVVGFGVSGLSVLGIGSAWLLETILTKRRRTEFVVADGILTVTVQGLFSSESTAHSLTDITAECVQLGTSIIGRRVFELNVRAAGYPVLSLLTAHDESEIQWVARVLTAARIAEAARPYTGTDVAAPP